LQIKIFKKSPFIVTPELIINFNVLKLKLKNSLRDKESEKTVTTEICLASGPKRNIGDFGER
jgi:hypothetical protein